MFSDLSTYHVKHLLFLTGPFTNLNAEEIETEVGDMWRTMYKLTKAFSDQQGPRRIADSVKGKIDKFKQHLPILQTICNPGIRDRHWEAVSLGPLPNLYFCRMIYFLIIFIFNL